MRRKGLGHPAHRGSQAAICHTLGSRDPHSVRRTSEHGDATVEFFAKATPGLLIAKGYDRIVYGDHGAYIEFSKTQVVFES